MIKLHMEGKMTKEERREAWLDTVSEMEPELIVYDGLDDALIGLGQQFNTTALVYDIKKVIEIFVEDGMSEEDAVEHFNFNVVGAWTGEHTPIFLEKWEEDDRDPE